MNKRNAKEDSCYLLILTEDNISTAVCQFVVKLNVYGSPSWTPPLEYTPRETLMINVVFAGSGALIG